MDNIDGTDSNTESQGTLTNYIIESVNYASLRTPARSRKRCIHRLPHHFHGDSRNQHVYEPVVLSIGPYHHGQPQFLPTEELKSEMLLQFVAESVQMDATKDRDFLYKEILERINEIEGFYEGVHKYNSEELAGIILRDTCFLINFLMKRELVYVMCCDHLGQGNALWLFKDVWKLENQIPFWVFKHILYLTFGKDVGDAKLIESFRHDYLMEHNAIKGLPWKDQKDEPLHLLEARRAFLLQESEAETKADHFLTKLLSKCNKTRKSNVLERNYSQSQTLKSISFPCRSITYLQAKGIYLKPSSRSIRDVKFTSKPCYGILQLPILYVDHEDMIFFSNIAAFELLTRGPTDFQMTFYVNFMKSLLESPKDVKVLQEKGILYSNLGTDAEIVKAFNDIDTHRMKDFGDIFDDLRSRIEEHCNSKAKTWMSDLVHIYFRNPWTVIPLLAATFILCLTFLQTYFTIRSPK